MSDALKIDTEVVNTSGGNVNTSGVNFQEEVSKFKNHVSSIMGIWTGPDAEEFERVAQEVGDALDKAALTVQDVGTHFEKTATGFEEQVGENVAMFSKL